MAEKEVEFSKNGGKLKITFDIGENHSGVSTFFLFDKDGNRLQREETTSTFTTFELITDPRNLDGSRLILDITIISAIKKSGQKWAFTVTLKQDGESIGVFKYPEPNGEDPKTFTKFLVIETKKVRLKAK